MPEYTEEEIRQVEEDKQYWQKYGDIFGWTLSGWTYKQSAQFFREDGSSVYIGGHGHIRTEEIDNLIKTLTE